MKKKESIDYPEDSEFNDYKLVGVSEFDDSYDLEIESGTHLMIPKVEGVVPKVGSAARFYGRGFGFTVRGVFIDGQQVYYRNEEQDQAKHDEWVKDTRKEYAEEYKKLMKEIKNEKPFETIDITGMGSGYERATQLALRAGITYLKKNPKFKFDYQGFTNVYGICWSDSEPAKELDKVLSDSCEGMSGAMHQALIGHLCYIHKNSVEKWLKEFKDRKYTYPSELPGPSF